MALPPDLLPEEKYVQETWATVSALPRRALKNVDFRSLCRRTAWGFVERCVLKLSSEPLLHHMEMKNVCASGPFGAQTWSLARPSLCFRALHIFKGDTNAVCAFLGPGSHIEVKHVLPNVPKLPPLDRNNCSCLAEALKHVDAHMSLQNMLVYFLTKEAHPKHI